MIGKGAALVLGSQLVAVIIHTLVKFLETRSHADTQQILQARFFLALIVNTSILRSRNPDALPLGSKQLRELLVLRAMGGICGAAGFYCMYFRKCGVWGQYFAFLLTDIAMAPDSLSYLPLGDATTLNLLAPLGAGLIQTFVGKGRFTPIQLAAVFIAFIGIGLVTKPGLTFDLITRGFASPLASAEPQSYQSGNINKGFGCALLGIIGGILSYTTIASIGNRVHPLVISNCFSVGMLVFSSVCFALLPGVTFDFHLDLLQWLVLATIGLFGTLMEYLLTAGLAEEKRGYAVHMLYSQAVLALIAQALVWHIVPDIASCVGAFLIVLGLFFISESERNACEQTSAV
ncbi:uncharacterized protein PAC_02404 [Phialocephala subalpina]|uniref:EamA domain-containing protein n=1 Tax=Phialocephala subalpina TaxID=576137 RepID=A0A1L7WIE7_9HELO|nr:uncharacterized protein PAC_02404 [Phialocephala subalpina]